MANETKRPYESNDPNRMGNEPARRQPGSETERERSGKPGSPDADRDRWSQSGSRPGQGGNTGSTGKPSDRESGAKEDETETEEDR